jgi:hypothetical protein
MTQQAYETVRLDEISDIGAVVPDGRYTARLTGAEGKMSKAETPNPMVVANFEILKGEHEGLESSKFFVLNVSRKNGKVYAGGIMDFKRTLANVGKPLPTGYAFPLDKDAAANLLVKSLKGMNLDISIKSEKNTKDGKTYSRLQVNGLASGGVETVDDDNEFDDFEDVTN